MPHNINDLYGISPTMVEASRVARAVAVRDVVRSGTEEDIRDTR